MSHFKPGTLAQFQAYAAYHQNDTNELIHKICVPIILITILMALAWFPFTLAAPGMAAAWEPSCWWIGGRLTYGHLAFLFLWLYYLSLDLKLGAFMTLYWVSFPLATLLSWKLVLLTFFLAWVGQFIGHGMFEKKSPAFLTTPWQLIIGPIYVMAVTLGMDVPPAPAAGAATGA